MSWIALIVFGGLVGWLAGIVMRTSAQQGIVPSILIGIAGAGIGNLLFAGLLLGRITLGRFPPSPATLLASFLGAVLLIAVFKAMRRARA